MPFGDVPYIARPHPEQTGHSGELQLSIVVCIPIACICMFNRNISSIHSLGILYVIDMYLILNVFLFSLPHKITKDLEIDVHY